MKKVLVVLVLSLGLTPASGKGYNTEDLKNGSTASIIQKATTSASQEVLNKVVGEHTLKPFGIPLLSTDDVAHVVGGIAGNELIRTGVQYPNTTFEHLSRQEKVREAAILYARKKLIDSTHWLLKDTAGWSLPTWVHSSPTTMNLLGIGETLIANTVAKSIMDKLWTTES